MTLIIDPDELHLIGGFLGLAPDQALEVISPLDWRDFNSPVLGAVFELIASVVRHGASPTPSAVSAEAWHATGRQGYGTDDLLEALIEARLAAPCVEMGGVLVLRDLVRLRSARPGTRGVSS